MNGTRGMTAFQLCFRQAKFPCQKPSCLSSVQSFLYQPKRFFDRKQYFQEKRRLRKLNDKENVEFDEAMEVFRIYCLGEDRPIQAHIRTEKPEGGRPVRGEVRFPKPLQNDGEGDKSVILVFAKGQQAEVAKQLGAHIVGAESVIQDITEDKLKFDKVLCTKEMFPQVIKIAKYLGPKGLMPSPARGTVSDDIEAMMASIKASTKFELDQDGFAHLEVANSSWKDEEIKTNLEALLSAVFDSRPSKVNEATFIKQVSMSGGMTPGVILPRRKLMGAITSRK